MRAFIAIDLNNTLKTGIHELQGRLKTSRADVKWVAPENSHLTIKFLGNVQENLVESIKSAMSASANGIKPFEIYFKGLGAFPSMKRPRVIWIGSRGAEPVFEFFNKLDERLSQLGFAKEDRPFAPHLTIGRVRTAKGLENLVKSMLENQEYELGRLLVENVILFQSTLTPRGPIYSKLSSITFN